MTHVPFFDLKSLVQSETTEILNVIKSVLEDGQYIGGKYVSEFENQFASYLGVKEFIGVGNGLDAIRLLLEAHGIGPGDEVIVPAFTYYATWLAVTQTGATLVPVDVEIDTALLDPELIESSISSKTKAILVVNLYGIPASLLEIQQIAKKHNLIVIEDCAQSHGAISNAGMTGAKTDGGAFSFYPTKNLGALGDAGGISTNDEHFANVIRSRRSYGQGASKYDHIDTGWNSRLDPIQAVILSQHLAKLDEWTERRKSIANTYIEALGEPVDSLLVGNKVRQNSVWHHFVLKLENRETWQQYFSNQGIMTDVHYPYFINEVKALKPWLKESRVDFPNSIQLARTVTSFPMGPWMNDSQIETVAEKLSEFSRIYM